MIVCFVRSPQRAIGLTHQLVAFLLHRRTGQHDQRHHNTLLCLLRAILMTDTTRTSTVVRVQALTVPEVDDLAPHMAFSLQLDASALGSARCYDLTNDYTPLRRLYIPPHFQQLSCVAFSVSLWVPFCALSDASPTLLNNSHATTWSARLLFAGDPTSKCASW